jgi:hypothetical protein
MIVTNRDGCTINAFRKQYQQKKIYIKIMQARKG